MVRTTLLVLGLGLLVGCAATATTHPASATMRASSATMPAPSAGPETLRYDNAQVVYEEYRRPDTRVRSVGGVTSITLDPHYVRFQTSQGTYVVPRERVVSVIPYPVVTRTPR